MNPYVHNRAIVRIYVYTHIHIHTYTHVTHIICKLTYTYTHTYIHLLHSYLHMHACMWHWQFPFQRGPHTCTLPRYHSSTRPKTDGTVVTKYAPTPTHAKISVRVLRHIHTWRTLHLVHSDSIAYMYINHSHTLTIQAPFIHTYRRAELVCICTISTRTTNTREYLERETANTYQTTYSCMKWNGCVFVHVFYRYVYDSKGLHTYCTCARDWNIIGKETATRLRHRA